MLITALLAIKGEEVALCEDGLFVPEAGIETLERLVRRPHTFALRSYRLSAREREVVEALRDPGREDAEGSEGNEGSGAAKRRQDGLIAIVRQLVRVVDGLPPYARRTRRRLSPSTRAVRDLLSTAKDPRTLLLDDLPRALQVDLAADHAPQTFARILRTSVFELVRAFPNLLDAVEEQVREAFGMQEQGRELQEALRRRLRPLLPHAWDPKLRLFLTAAAQEPRSNGRDWREALARAALDGKPPPRWRDGDEGACATRLRALAAECDVLGELVAAAGDESALTVASIGLLEPGAGERRVVIACSREERAPP